METVRAMAPAKVNLLLAIGNRRADGYHDAVTVMHSLALHDTLQATRIGSGEHVQLLEPCDPAQPLRQVEIEVPPNSGLVVSANTTWQSGLDAIDIPDEGNLACKAVRFLAEELGRAHDEHIRLVIDKGIPQQSGLGGGSADAAAALLAAARLWGLPANDEGIVRCAQWLGADVAFFLYGGCALLDDRGDHYVRSLVPRKDFVVIVKPEGGVSSADAYRLFDDDPKALPQDVVDDARRAQAAVDVPLANSLSNAAEALLPALADVREFARQQPGVVDALLTGSGAGSFLVCENFASARSVVSAASARGWWARATTFSPVGAALLPS